MDACDWLQKVDSKKILSAYLIKRLIENGGTMHVAHIQNELSDPHGIVADVVASMERADVVRFVSCDGRIAFVRAADRLPVRNRRKR
ncbi:MAG: hypothetical protein AAB950_00605 [Patescibacteria group bacterium]